jgi:hypothetical protein
MATAITTLFLDIGGVLLTNGWDDHMRRRAAEHFRLVWCCTSCGETVSQSSPQ